MVNAELVSSARGVSDSSGRNELAGVAQELARVGNNVNQIAYRLNAGHGAAAEWRATRAELDRVLGEIAGRL